MNEMLHPQKRRLLKELVVAAAGRLLELRHRLNELASSDFHQLNDILIDMKLCPEDLSVSVPRFYIEDREDQVSSRDALLVLLTKNRIALMQKTFHLGELNISNKILAWQMRFY